MTDKVSDHQQTVDSSIKQAITETIAEELFRKLGFFVVKLGKEHWAAPTTQLSYFIKKNFNISFDLEKPTLNDEGVMLGGPHDQIRLLPDFLVIDKKGRVNFLEVKFRWNGKLTEADSRIFFLYSKTILFVINLESPDGIGLIGTGIEEMNAESKQAWSRSRFHVYFCTGKQKADSSAQITAGTLREFLKVYLQVEDDKLLKMFELKARKWLSPSKIIEDRDYPQKIQYMVDYLKQTFP